MHAGINLIFGHVFYGENILYGVLYGDKEEYGCAAVVLRLWRALWGVGAVEENCVEMHTMKSNGENVARTYTS